MINDIIRIIWYGIYNRLLIVTLLLLTCIIAIASPDAAAAKILINSAEATYKEFNK